MYLRFPLGNVQPFFTTSPTHADRACENRAALARRYIELADDTEADDVTVDATNRHALAVEALEILMARGRGLREEHRALLHDERALVGRIARIQALGDRASATDVLALAVNLRALNDVRAKLDQVRGDLKENRDQSAKAEQATRSERERFKELAQEIADSSESDDESDDSDSAAEQPAKNLQQIDDDASVTLRRAPALSQPLARLHINGTAD